MDLTLTFGPDIILTFITLFALELVLGIDNIIFISILASRLPAAQRTKARNLGLVLAMLMRLGLVLAAGWLITLTEPVMEVFGNELSVKDLVLIAGGVFLVWKATTEIHHKIEGSDEGEAPRRGAATMSSVIVQIVVMDLVFSFDSVITAVGMTESFWVIACAVVASFAVILSAAGAIVGFVDRNPSVKILALSFLILIGAMLVAEGWNLHIDKAFIYGPVAFAILVEGLNIAQRRRANARRAAREEAATPDSPDV